jgi:hypothetical protein
VIIGQYKITPIAQAPDELAKCIGKYSDNHSFVITPGNLADAKKCDKIICHNKFYSFDKPTALMVHSEPEMVDYNAPVSVKMVISQYHATLPQFEKFVKVKNIIDFETAEYNINEVVGKIRIGYSPSRMNKMGNWHDKGYSQTVKILKTIKAYYPHLVDIDIIHGVPLAECISRKSKCNLIIDECITGSYHRSALEGLALGKATICYVSPDVEKVLKEVTGCDNIPFINVDINNLEQELCKLVELGWGNLNRIGNKNRTWMETYWHPRNIVNEFLRIYETIE